MIVHELCYYVSRLQIQSLLNIVPGLNNISPAIGQWQYPLWVIPSAFIFSAINKEFHPASMTTLMKKLFQYNTLYCVYTYHFIPG